MQTPGQTSARMKASLKKKRRADKNSENGNPAEHLSAASLPQWE